MIDLGFASKAPSQVTAFAVINNVAVAGLPTRFILWPDGKQSERK